MKSVAQMYITKKLNLHHTLTHTHKMDKKQDELTRVATPPKLPQFEYVSITTVSGPEYGKIVQWCSDEELQALIDDPKAALIVAWDVELSGTNSKKHGCVKCALSVVRVDTGAVVWEYCSGPIALAAGKEWEKRCVEQFWRVSGMERKYAEVRPASTDTGALSRLRLGATVAAEVAQFCKTLARHFGSHRLVPETDGTGTDIIFANQLLVENGHEDIQNIFGAYIPIRASESHHEGIANVTVQEKVNFEKKASDEKSGKHFSSNQAIKRWWVSKHGSILEERHYLATKQAIIPWPTNLDLHNPQTDARFTAQFDAKVQQCLLILKELYHLRPIPQLQPHFASATIVHAQPVQYYQPSGYPPTAWSFAS